LLRISKPDHGEIVRKVSVRRGRKTSLTLKLVPDFGHIQVHSRPAVKGAKVFLNGDEVGTAPLTLRHIYSGEHTLRVEARGYKPYETRVRTGGGKTKAVTADLERRTGRLLVDSVPYAAEIIIDGKPAGQAPLSIGDLPVGSHVVTARSPGRPPLVSRIQVKEGRNTLEMNIRTGHVKGAARRAKQPSSPSRRPATGSATVNPGAVPSVAFSDRPMSVRRKAAWATAGTAAAGGVASVFLFVLGSSTQSEADSTYLLGKREPFGARRDELIVRAKRMDEEAAAQFTGSWVCLGFSAVAAGVSLYLFLTEPSGPDPAGSRTRLGAAPLSGGGWFGLEHRF
jgi:hypothetical protein